MSYRFDNRTKNEFKKHILACTKIENELMKVYVDWLNVKRETGTDEFTFSDHGVDNTGKFIKDEKKVTTDADFLLQRNGKPDKKIDIKFCKPYRKFFHLKTGQMMSYIQQDVCIVNFMGIETDSPKFCILPPSVLGQWLERGKRVKFKPWGYKECIKFYDEDMDWHLL